MKKIIAVLLIAMMINSYNTICYAETLLTYYDTVVIKPSIDITSEEKTEDKSEVIKNTQKYSSLKDIISGAANTFFQK